MNIKKVKLAAIILATGVTAGALGAHALKAILTTDQLISYETAIRYLFIHGLGMLIISFMVKTNHNLINQSYWLFFLGIILFSGSIILLVLQSQLGLKLGFLGPITPVGGVLFILGWLNLLRLPKTPEGH